MVSRGYKFYGRSGNWILFLTNLYIIFLLAYCDRGKALRKRETQLGNATSSNRLCVLEYMPVSLPCSFVVLSGRFYCVNRESVFRVIIKSHLVYGRLLFWACKLS